MFWLWTPHYVRFWAAWKTALMPYLIVNAGNDHTLCAIVRNNKIDALLEHHTALLSTEKLRQLIIRFAKGEVSSSGGIR